MNFRNLKLANKQRLGFAAILGIMGAVNAFSLYNMASIKKEMDAVSRNWMPRAVAISDINRHSSELRRFQMQQTITPEAEGMQELNLACVNLIERIDQKQDLYDSLRTVSHELTLFSAAEDSLYSQFETKWDEYKFHSISFISLINEDRLQDAIELMTSGTQDIFDAFSKDLIALVDISQRNSFQAAQRTEKAFFATRRISLILLIFSFVLSIFIADRLVRFITIPVKQLEQGAGQVAKGELHVDIPVVSHDEVGNLARSFNQMTTALREAQEKTERQAQRLRGQNKVLEKAMRELRETQEKLVMQEKMASLGDLVAGIAHEINSPVGSVKSSVDVVSRCMDQLEGLIPKAGSQALQETGQSQKLFEILRGSIEVIKNASERIATLVKSLRNFANLDEAEFKRADIHDGLDSTLTLLRNEFGDRVEIQKQYSELPKIGCYPGELNQVFLNLFKNASNAITEKGIIAVKTFRQNDKVRIDISDTGVGIQKKKLERIFDFGFSSNKNRVKMTSGLSTAFNIVQKHRGEIKVDSEEGRGTCFSIFLPIR